MITYEDFTQVDIRVGRIVTVEDFPQARKPAYKLTIDFGAAIGVKRSSAQITTLYAKDDLLGMLVLILLTPPYHRAMARRVSSDEKKVRPSRLPASVL